MVSGNKFVTVANGLSQNFKPSTLSDAATPYPIHRLDYGTTGALLIGKTASSIRRLSQLFEDKMIEKTYYAITINKHKDTAGKIETHEENKVLISHYEILATVDSEKVHSPELAETSTRNRQKAPIEKAHGAAGNPILGDKDYGIEGLILNGKGMYLHAYSLKLAHPFTDKELSIEAPVPKEVLEDLSRNEIRVH